MCSLPADPVALPDEVSNNYGVTIALLSDVFDDEATSTWSLHGVEFYRTLHQFLKKWDTTHSLTKTSIGKFYLAIDKEEAVLIIPTDLLKNWYLLSDVPDLALMS